MTQDRKQSIGALWRKTSKAGNPFYSGEITLGGETVKLVAFDNDRKEKETHPDIRIYISEPLGEHQNRRSEEDNAQGLADLPNRGLRSGYMRAPTAPPTRIEYPKDDIDPDDIPF